MKYGIILFATSILFFFSCKEDEIENPDFPNGCDYELGEINLLPSSIDSLPFEGMTKVFFDDSFGNEIFFTITSTEIFQSPNSIGLFDPLTGKERRLCYYQETKSYTMLNDTLSMRIGVELRAQPEWKILPSERVFDALYIELSQKGTLPVYVTKSTFATTVANHSGEPVSDLFLLDSLVCHNQTYYGVAFQDFPLNLGGIYYKQPYGIISFKDIEDKRWCFDRFE